jgi:hypothetical protein
MARSRKRASRGGAEGERFALLPESMLLSEAVTTGPPSLVHFLAMLVNGYPPERNGTMMATDAFAARFGFTSHETLQRCRNESLERGLIVRTRHGQRMRKVPTLWAVTWWPIAYRDGQPLLQPEPATHDYLRWKYTPSIGGQQKNLHTGIRGSTTPTDGVNTPPLHPGFAVHSPDLHPDRRAYSENLGAGAVNGRDAKVHKLLVSLPHLPNSDIAKITREPIEFVQQVRAFHELRGDQSGGFSQ